MTNEKDREEIRRGNLYEWLAPKLSIEERDTLDNLLHCVEKNAKAEAVKAERDKMSLCELEKAILGYPCSSDYKQASILICREIFEQHSIDAILSTDQGTAESETRRTCVTCANHKVGINKCEGCTNFSNWKEQGYWWCPECKEEVIPQRVTFQECHDTCGTRVIWKEPSSAEPEPCEDAREWDALTKEEMWNEIQDIRRLVDSDGTRPISSDIEDYATHVADNRAEELLAQVEMLREALRDRDSYYYARDVPHQSQHEHCRCRKCVDARVEKALAATEPKQ